MASDDLAAQGDVVLGLDLATAQARCVAVDTTTGAVLASASAALGAPRRTGVSSTQTPTYAAVALRLVGRVTMDLGSAATRVRGLSTTGTSGTVVAVDARGAARGDALLYDDRSGADLAVAQGLPPGSMLARMAVLATPGTVGIATTVDVVHAALLGERVASDTSHTLKAGIDAEAAAWPIPAATALGLEARVLPRLVHPGTVLGHVDATVAAALGLPTGVLVVAGMTDGCTGQIATGAIHPGDGVGVLGTTLVLKGVSPTEITTLDGSIYSHLSPDGRWWPGGASSSGGGVLAARWPDLDRSRVSALDAAAAERGPATVSCYPLARVGERFPVADPGFGGAWSGEPLDDVDAYRAVLEGVAFVERLGIETLGRLGAPSRRHVLAGGATRSGAWSSIRAAVVSGAGVEVAVSTAGSSAVGAALVAASALEPRSGGSSLAATVDRLVAPPEPVTSLDPPAELEASYRRFLTLLPEPVSPAPAP